MVIFTSDESHGVLGHPFGGHWGLFVALGDGVPERLSPQVFGQADVALSVLDYLGWTMRIFSDEASFVITLRFAPCPLAALYWILRGVFFHAKGSFAIYINGKPAAFLLPLIGCPRSPPPPPLCHRKNNGMFSLAPICFWGEAQTPLYSLNGIFFLALKQQQIQPYKLFLPQKSQVEVVLNVENTGEAAAHFYAFWGKLRRRKVKTTTQCSPARFAVRRRFELTYSFYNEKAQNAVFNFVALSHKEQTNAVMRELKISATPSDNRDFNVKHFQIYAQDIAVGRDKNGARVFVDDLENANQNDEGIKFLALAQTSNANDAFSPRAIRSANGWIFRQTVRGATRWRWLPIGRFRNLGGFGQAEIAGACYVAW